MRTVIANQTPLHTIINPLVSKKSPKILSSKRPATTRHIRPYTLIKGIESIQPSNRVMMLWDEDEEGLSMAISNSSNKDKWKQKVGNKTDFMDIEIDINMFLEDEYWREQAFMV